MTEETATTYEEADVDSYIIKFMSSMKTTAAARFNAARRLESRSRSINFMLAMLSSSVIVTSVLPFTANFENWLEVSIFLVGLAASIFTVVLSLYQWSSRDDINAEKLHQAGMKISELRRRTKLNFMDRHNGDSTESVDDWLENTVERYSEILRECGINHDDTDYVRVKLEQERNAERTWSMKPALLFYTLTTRVHSLAMISFAIFLLVLGILGLSVYHIVTHPQHEIGRFVPEDASALITQASEEPPSRGQSPSVTQN